LTTTGPEINETATKFYDRCFICNSTLNFEAANPTACYHCKRTYFPALIKACHDQYHYTLSLKNGTTIDFAKAWINGNTVTLYQLQNEPFDHYEFPKGIEIGYRDILWVANGPIIFE
jgi:hypothetical protein